MMHGEDSDVTTESGAPVLQVESRPLPRAL